MLLDALLLQLLYLLLPLLILPLQGLDVLVFALLLGIYGLDFGLGVLEAPLVLLRAALSEVHQIDKLVAVAGLLLQGLGALGLNLHELLLLLHAVLFQLVRGHDSSTRSEQRQRPTSLQR